MHPAELPATVLLCAVYAVLCCAVMCCVAAPPEGPLEAQWDSLDAAADLLALAPDDEVLAELLTLQVRLLSWCMCLWWGCALLVQQAVGRLLESLRQGRKSLLTCWH